MSKRTKVMLLSLLTLFLTIQLISPVRNESGRGFDDDILRVYPIPEKVQAILRKSCYDCHSNKTIYPWYSKFQPVRWWMYSHIENGKAQLNFSEFGKYSKRKQQSKLKSMAGRIEDESMPLGSYMVIHRDSYLSETDKMLVLGWIKMRSDSLLKDK